MNWAELYRCFFDAFMVIWFFLPLEERRVSPPFRRGLLFLLLLATAPIYISPGGGELAVALFRFVYRAAIYALWLWLRKGTSLQDSVYYGVLCWIAFTTQNNIFLTPQLSALRWNQVAWTSLQPLNRVISVGLELLAEFLILTLISRAFPFGNDRPTGPFRFGTVAVVVICQLYVKATLKAMTEALPERYVSELTIYPILLQTLLTASLVLLERHLSSRAKRERERLDEVAARYRYETAQARADADTDLRQLHHDMKNHLLGLRQLAGDNEKLEGYIDQLLQRTREYEVLVDTGSALLDGLISEKIRRADKEGIDLTAAVDFRQGEFLSDMDLCTIFGNALDNAIEASMKVADPDRRSILVKCAPAAGNLVLTVMNYYEGELRQSGQILLTSKSEPGHGLGLSSLRHAAEKYGGVVTTSTDPYHNFILTILIPLPVETA